MARRRKFKVSVAAPHLCDHCRYPLSRERLLRAIEGAIRRKSTMALVGCSRCGLASVVAYAPTGDKPNQVGVS